jgi:hypothetical protein
LFMLMLLLVVWRRGTSDVVRVLRPMSFGMYTLSHPRPPRGVGVASLNV